MHARSDYMSALLSVYAMLHHFVDLLLSLFANLTQNENFFNCGSRQQCIQCKEKQLIITHSSNVEIK